MTEKNTYPFGLVSSKDTADIVEMVDYAERRVLDQNDSPFKRCTDSTVWVLPLGALPRSTQSLDVADALQDVLKGALQWSFSTGLHASPY